MNPDGTDSPHLVCVQCGLAKAPGEFRRRFTDRETRVRQCRQCHADAERLRRHAKRSRGHRQAVNRELARLKQAKSTRQVALVCDTMIRGFGGADGVAQAWMVVMERDLKRGGFAALRHLEAALRLIQHCDEQRPDYRSMTDEELLAILAEHS